MMGMKLMQALVLASIFLCYGMTLSGGSMSAIRFDTPFQRARWLIMYLGGSMFWAFTYVAIFGSDLTEMP